MKGTTQNSKENDPGFIDLCDYKFYEGINFRLSFSKQCVGGPATNGEVDTLQLHTYGNVSEYYWQSPNLVKNNN